MKKVLTVILMITAMIGILVKLIEPNIEMYGIKAEWLAIVSTTALIIKQFIESSGLLTKDEAAQFANYHNSKTRLLKNNDHLATAQDVKSWLPK